MKIFRNPITVKIVIFFTFLTFAIASLSPEFMFTMLGSSSSEPFIEIIYQGCLVWSTALGWNIGTRKEAGIFAMLALLAIIAIFYITYKTLKTIYERNKNANKAIKKDV